MQLFCQRPIDDLLRLGLESEDRSHMCMTGVHEPITIFFWPLQRHLMGMDRTVRKIFKPGQGNKALALFFSSFLVGKAMAQEIDSGRLIAHKNSLRPPALKETRSAFVGLRLLVQDKAHDVVWGSPIKPLLIFRRDHVIRGGNYFGEVPYLVLVIEGPAKGEDAYHIK